MWIEFDGKLINFLYMERFWCDGNGVIASIDLNNPNNSVCELFEEEEEAQARYREIKQELLKHQRLMRRPEHEM